MKKNKSEKDLQYLVYSSIKSAAESGIDFSSRWFTDQKNMESIETIYQIPVDLNSLIYNNLKIMESLYKMKNNDQKAKAYAEKANNLAELINKVLWNKKDKCWNDYHFKRKKYVDFSFFPSNLFPLFFKIDTPKGTTPYELISKYQNDIFGDVGGIPSSGPEANNGQQWEYPNVWAPYVYLFHEYFSSTLKEEKLAYHIARSFFNSVSVNFRRTNIFYEKYKVTNTGEVGLGGEYPNQEGFGWTNGVTICFLKQYGDQLADDFNTKQSVSSIQRLIKDKLSASISESESPSSILRSEDEIIPQKRQRTQA